MADQVQYTDLRDLRDEIADYIKTFGLTLNVLKRRRLVVNRLAFVQKYGVLPPSGPKEKQIRFCELELIRMIDSGEGADDRPVMTAVFNVHLFFEFYDADDDDANSDAEFLAWILKFREKFLDVRDFAAGDFFAKSQPLAMPENIQFGGDAFTDAQGHFVDLQLEFELYDTDD